MKKLVMAMTITAFIAAITNVNAQDKAAPVKAAPVKAATRPATDAKPMTTQVADQVDATMKGPNGETVYSGPKGGKYYMAANNKKVYIDAKVDPSLKGPKGQTVYTGSKGGKYYLDGKGEKVYMGDKNKTDKAPVKPGSVKRTESAAPATR